MNTKRTAKVALATFGLSVMLPTAAFAATDTQGHWAGSVLAKWESQALISGYEDGTIRPNNEISRAEFVALVNRVAGYQAAGSTVKFSDVKTGDWYAGQVAIAVNEGYIGGFEDNTFRPNDSVTRAQAAAIIARIKNLPSDAARANQFADAAATPDWAKGVVGAVANAGYMIGDEANNFNAEKALTRAEAVASLDRVFGVKELTAQSIMLSATEGAIAKGASRTITVTASAENAVITAVSGDTDVATVTVKDGKVTIKGVEKGTATITVTAKADGYQTATATYQVTVTVAAGGGGGSSSSSSGGSSTSNSGELKSSQIDTTGVSADTTNLRIVYAHDNAVANELQETVDATIEIINMPADVTVKKATLAAGTRISVTNPTETNTYVFLLTDDLVKGENDLNGGQIVITAEDVYTRIPAGNSAKNALKAIYEANSDRALIVGTINGDNTIHWVAQTGSINSWNNIFSNMEIVLADKTR